jgi:FAD/FMN-containing dehydrogenase
MLPAHFNPEAFFAALTAAVGDAHVLRTGDLSHWERDWRKRYIGKALAVVRPGNTAQVAAVVRLCAQHQVTIVPQGGNTGLVGGGVPDDSGHQVLLSLSRLQRVRDMDAANLTMTVEAGCTLQAVQAAADSAGLLFPLSLASEGSCTIGGNLATNAGGTQVLRYGNTRELCLGLEVVTADGDVWEGLSGLRKDNTGYDLRDLFVGSEGTLGIITAATLKLHPRPACQLTALAACPDVKAALTLLQLARQQLDAGLTAFELMSSFSLALVARHFPQWPHPFPAQAWTVLLELSTHATAMAKEALEGLLSQAMAQGCVEDAIVAENLTQARALWQRREAISLAQSEEGLNIKHDIALPVSAIPAFLSEMDSTVEQLTPGARLVTFGHLGDGNLHYNVQAPVGVAAEEFLARHEPALNLAVYAAVQRHQGSISAEHGIGQLKRDQLPDYKSATALRLMRAIKLALDPEGRMNPGRLL